KVICTNLALAPYAIPMNKLSSLMSYKLGAESTKHRDSFFKNKTHDISDRNIFPNINQKPVKLSVSSSRQSSATTRNTHIDYNVSNNVEIIKVNYLINN